MSTVAVIGLNGHLGEATINALLSEPFISKVKAPLRLLTQSDKRAYDSSKVEYINTKEVEFEKALEGVDVLINLTTFPNPNNEKILDAAIAQKVKLYIPTQFGTDLPASDTILPGFLEGKTVHSARARSNGIKTIDVITGLFVTDAFGPFVSYLVEVNGSDAVIHGDDNTPVNPSFLEDVGKAVAAIVTREDYSKLPDTIRIYSDKATIGDLIDKYEKKNNVKLNKTYKSSQEFYNNVTEKYAKNGFEFNDFFRYLGAILAAGEGKGLIFEKNNERELINPNESVFKWTKFDSY